MRSIPPIMGGIQPCHPMIACAPLPPAPSPTTSRTPHSVEHRPRQTVLRQRYNLAQSKHAVAYCWRWRRTYFTLREDRLHEAQTEPNYDNACAYRDANGSLFLCTRTPMPSGRTSSGRDELALAHLPHTRQQLCATQLEAPPAR